MPILLSSSSIKYFSFAYVLLIPILLLTLKAPHLHLKRAWSFWILIIVNTLNLLVFFDDKQSAINIITLMVSYISLFWLVSRSIDICGSFVTKNTVFKNISILLIISFVISLILTLLQWPASAPNYFPWEAFYSDKRLLLITGNNVGHSNAMWLMAFSGVYFIRKRYYILNKDRKIIYDLLTIMLFLFLVATKSRLALIFIGVLIMTWLCYRKILGRHFFSIFMLVLPPLYFLSIVVPFINNKTVEFTETLQNAIPSVRLSPSSHLQGEESVYTGRYALNLMLISAAIEHPWFGIGHSDDRMRYGVTQEGFIAYREDAVASTESGLRMLAKYGAFYYSSLLLFILTPIFRAFKGYYKDNIFVIAVCSIIFLTAIGRTIFENLYGLSGLFTIILLTFHLTKPYRKSRGLASNKTL